MSRLEVSSDFAARDFEIVANEFVVDVSAPSTMKREHYLIQCCREGQIKAISRDGYGVL